MVAIDKQAGPLFWVLVADEYQAKIFSREEKFSDLVEVEHFENPVARMKTGEVMADKGGRAFDSKGQGRHSMTSDKANPKTQSYAAFAKEIAQHVGKAAQKGRFARLIVVSAPRFLGVLRPALEIAGVEPERTLDKEVTGRDGEFIGKLIDSS